MFVSQESNKRRFPKPNILRRKTKASVKRTGASNVSSSIEPLTTNPNAIHTTIITDLELQTISKHKCVKPFQAVQKSLVQNKVLSCQIETVDSIQSSQNVDNESSQVNIDNEENPEQPSDNEESFFKDGENRENVMLFSFQPSKKMQTVVIIDNESHVEGQSSQPSNGLITSMVPLSAVSTPSIKARVKEQKPTSTTVVSQQQLLENTTLAPIKYKCDYPDCKKQFRSDKKWNKHQLSHMRNNGVRVPRQVSVECPVKKVDSDGTEQSCGKTYLDREQLAKHLNEDHTCEDAGYRCEQCGRRFFWAMGLRAHERGHAVRARPAALACGWPGCGRVFAVPCRLREHARAHTGDKPYACRFANCDASFRSASKLERHARRHTGIRRHACSTCGRAFLRREHLRDHTARLHAKQPQQRPQLARPHEEREQSEDADALQEHDYNTHNDNTDYEKDEPAAAEVELSGVESLLKDNLDYILMDEDASDTTQEMEEKGDDEGDDVAEEAAEAGEEADAELECRAARTHYPWPFASRFPADTDYELDGDATVEQPEESESNICTVRSDLFLHGNVLINEDSVQMGSAVENAEVATETSAPNDELGLGLLEHPHIDLMQEEMMFTAWQ